MCSLINDFFKVLFKDFHPGLHEMYVLEHAPVTSFSCFFECLDSIVFLTLSHGNVNECSIGNGLSILSSNQFDFWSWINTWEKHEEDWSLDISLWVSSFNIEWLLFNIVSSHVLSNKLSQSIGKSIRSKSSQE